jgi:DNA-directed RNA polymerase sigma subunit (sigma70/sigma32)
VLAKQEEEEAVRAAFLKRVGSPTHLASQYGISRERVWQIELCLMVR